MNGREQYKLNELLLYAVEGDLTGEQAEELNRLILHETDSVRYYFEFINLYSELSPYGRIGYIGEGYNSDIHKFDLLLNRWLRRKTPLRVLKFQRLDLNQKASAYKKSAIPR